MKQIKTIIYPVEKSAQFDFAVNDLLCAGWELIKRDVITTPGVPSESFKALGVQSLYAELEWQSMN